MSSTLKKILVILPVTILTVFFLLWHYKNQYRHASNKQLLALAFTILIVYGWIIAGILRRTQESFFQILLQSSFYVYVFMVLTLTGYFILFREVSMHGWWQRILLRIENKNGVNIIPLKSIKMYKYGGYQVMGNLIMLLPLGIYLPLLYPGMNRFFKVALVCMTISVSIELMQLATSFRVSDVDDVILNTLGACLGYLFFKFIQSVGGNEFLALKSYSPLKDK